MKVLFDGQVFVHQVTGGVSRYFANLVACSHWPAAVRSAGRAMLNCGNYPREVIL